MIPQVKVLKKILRRADLGLRFTDHVRRATVSDGLVVQAWMKGTTAPRFPAYRSPVSGIYGFHSLPGLRGYENGERPASDFCSGEGSDNFAVTVEDRLGRFLPQLLLMCLPKEQVVETPLFSSPARPTPSGLGVIRGELWDRAAAAPASWAMVSAVFGAEEPWMTVADERGMFALFVPYAAAMPALTGSPPSTTATIGEMQWNVTIRAFYKPQSLRRVEGSHVPDTRSVLEQSQGAIYSVLDGENALLPNSSLVKAIGFGVELVVATQNSARLIIDPAAH